jgi:hypothetical protein
MANSNITLQNVIDDANSLGDVAPALATGGFSDAPALSIANDVMQAMINGGPNAQPYNWKWNSFNVAPFCTISYQSDYFVPGLINLGWIENAWAVNINQTSVPKQKQYLEAKKNLQVTYDQTGYPGKICWMQNSNLNAGTWGQAPLGPTAGNPQGNINGLGPGLTGQQNPGPNVIYTNPVGILSQPTNATTCIKDPNGNLWALTTYGTCGATQPSWPTTPVFPTVVSPNTVATTVTDGSVVWTAINPAGQGFRLNPIPPSNGVVWVITVVGQMRANRFSNVAQTLEPIPDDYEWAFKQGFFAQCYRRNPDPKIRAKFTMEQQIWLKALDDAVRQSDREEDDFGFFPGSSVMQSGIGVNPINPAYPFGAWNGN